MSEDADWLQVVARVVRAHFDETQGRGLLLAKVSGVLQAEGIDLPEVLGGRRLKAVLEAEATDSVSLVQHPLQPLVWALLPASESLPANLLDIFPPAKPVSGPAQRLPSFEPGFWSAFVKPLSEDHRRTISTDQRPTVFVDHPASSTEINEAFEVDRSDIIPADLSGIQKVEAVRSKASQWATRKGLLIESFYVNRAKSSPKLSDSWVERLLRLDDNDLARISIPLDIVKRIF